MSDESTQLILGDAAADALGQPPGRRGIFRRKKKNQPAPLTHCENCGAPLSGQYCAACGQHAIDYRRSLFHIVVDAADSFFNWDTKFFKTIGILLWKPWRLTNDFNAGRRARYVHPLRLYLLASITFFLVLRAVNFQGSGPIELTAEDRAGFATSLEKLSGPDSPLAPEERARVDVLRTKLATGDGQLTKAERGEIKAAFAEVMKSTIKKSWSKEDRANFRKTINNLPTQPTPVAESASPSPTPVVENGGVSPSPGEKEKLHFKWGGGDQATTPFETWMEGRIKEKVGEDGTKVTLFLETLRQNIPTMMLCCIPLFALILKILYLGKRRYYIEHLVYALHIHSFIFLGVGLLVALVMLANRTAPTLGGLLIASFSIALTVQIFLSIRRVYAQGWFFTLVKFCLGGVAYLVVLSLAVGVTAFITILLPG
ncbi:MAG: DUF3667 domain-containing protein [Chthoniobacterales bacterium]